MAQRTGSRDGGKARRPGGTSGPGRVANAARRAAEARVAAAAAAEKLKKVDPRRNPKFTGRAVILLLVCAVLVLSFASSLQAYLKQRESIDEMKTSIAKRQAAIEELEVEKERWNDPAYVEQQARQRFGYVMPGETSYVVLDAQGNRIQPTGELSDPDSVGDHKPVAWWTTVWESIELAGDPPEEVEQPRTKITETQ